MKKAKIILAGAGASALLFASSMQIFAAGPYNAIPLDKNQAWEDSGLGSISNSPRKK